MSIAMIGFVLVLLPIVMTLLLLVHHDAGSRQRAIVGITALASLAIVVGYTYRFSLQTGDTWIGVLLLPVVPYALVLSVLRFRVLERRPGLILVFVPFAFLVGFVAFVLLAVNVGLIGPPF